MNAQVKTASSCDLGLAYVVLRIATGVDLLGHGLIRLWGNYETFHDWLLKTFASSPLPLSVVGLTGWLIPPIELILGLLLLIGYRTRETLVAASAIMIVFIFGSCLIQNWEMVELQLVYVIVYSILIALRAYNRFALGSR